MNKKQVAVIISRVFDPVWMIPGMLAVAAGWSLLNGLRWRFIVILLLIDGLIPFIYFVHLLSTKEISDWDTTKREQRLKLYGFVLVAHSIGAVLAFLLGKLILSKILFVISNIGFCFYPDHSQMENLHSYRSLIGGNNFPVVTLWVELVMVIFNCWVSRLVQNRHEKTYIGAGHRWSRDSCRNNSLGV